MTEPTAPPRPLSSCDLGAPSRWLGWANLATVLCTPLGVVALVFAVLAQIGRVAAALGPSSGSGS
ncbi:MAG TPA: hypothetical protein VGJ54_07225 [Streptosporangiaceae bacterium]